MKIILLSYHKNASNLYKKDWIEEYKYSVVNQTYKYFTVLECNYGDDNFRVFENSIFEKKPSSNFVDTLNWMLDLCFNELDCDYVFNSNLDDKMSLDRIELQLEYLKQGYDIVSSNFCLVRDGKIILFHKFDEVNIEGQLMADHNIIAHASVAYSKNFWKNNRYIADEQPKEDLRLWQRAIKTGSKFIILKENLLFHRLHSQSVCESQNR